MGPGIGEIMSGILSNGGLSQFTNKTVRELL
jgi:hypothetical protein